MLFTNLSKAIWEKSNDVRYSFYIQNEHHGIHNLKLSNIIKQLLNLKFVIKWKIRQVLIQNVSFLRYISYLGVAPWKKNSQSKHCQDRSFKSSAKNKANLEDCSVDVLHAKCVHHCKESKRSDCKPRRKILIFKQLLIVTRGK